MLPVVVWSVLDRWIVGEDHVGLRPAHGVDDSPAGFERIQQQFVVVANEATSASRSFADSRASASRVAPTSSRVLMTLDP